MLNVICFSKNRPLQLHACLASWFANISEPELLKFQVLAYVQPEYATAYAQVSAEFPQVNFHTQTNFAQDMVQLIDTSEFTCFCCDDVVMIQPVVLTEAMEFLRQEESLGLSLRLGKNIQQGFFPSPMRQPEFTERGQFIVWSMLGADQDWCYPWEVLGTIYRTEFVGNMWASIAHANNPSEFEALGAQSWQNATNQRMYAAWSSARVLAPTINVVQNVFANGWIGSQSIPVELLLLCWQFGFRLDVERYAEQTYATWRIGDVFLKRCV